MGRRAPLAPFREYIMCNTRKPLPQHRLSWNQGHIAGTRVEAEAALPLAQLVF